MTASISKTREEGYDDAVALVKRLGQYQTIGCIDLQRNLRIGYNHAARLLEAMESDGVVSASGSDGRRTLRAQTPVLNGGW
jgi:S-DNA-T family DNA segregation ATPase FtsK/SpoIIIE